MSTPEASRAPIADRNQQHETEIRCYIRDPDGYLIEVGQTTLPGGWRQFLRV